MSKSKSIGTNTETAVVRYLREHGWPQAERRALAGALDLGDVIGTPGLCWEVKGGAVAQACTESDLAKWMAETERERVNSGSDVGILVTRRTGYGVTRAGWWWAHVPLGTIQRLSGQYLADVAAGPPVRMLLADMCWLLHRAGYGDEVAA